MTNIIDNIAALPFVDRLRPSDCGTYWRVEPTGDYAIDCSTGRDMAGKLTDFLRRYDAPYVLGHVAAAIGKLDRPWSGIEVAFFSAMASAVAVRG